jgi:hypothetical protein
METAGQLFDLGREINGANIEALEGEKERELALAGNNANARARIEENYQKKIIALKRKQAIYDKLQSLFDIGINTAVGISAALKNPLTAPFMIPFIIAQGVISAAMVLAKPLPKYAKGRKGGKAEHAEINEQGFELLEKDGKFRIANGGERGVDFLQAGETVHTHTESRKILEDHLHSHDSDDFLDSLLKGTGVVRQHEHIKEQRLLQAVASNSISEATLERTWRKALKGLPINSLIFDERGMRKFVEEQGNKTEILNGRTKLGGNG